MRSILFIGDSVTDCGRDRTDPHSLGDGYVARIAAAQPTWTLHNRGISGNRVRDLRARWGTDCLDLAPSLVSVLIGVNDTWRRYDRDDPTSAEEYEEDYDAILAETTRRLSARLVLVEPFLLPVRPEQEAWREDLEPKLEVVRRLARTYDATLVPVDVALTEAAREEGAATLAHDGVHPTPRGHDLIATSWLATVGPVES
ncbi:MAG TPA: SGNH/GDSL hydrolase family protein [Actinopolymorphaceae bacterium]